MRSSRWKPTSDLPATASDSSSSASAVRGVAAVQRDLGQPLQREGLADGAAARAAQPDGLAQVHLGLGQPAREQVRLAAQRHRVGAPPGRSEPLGLCGESVGERDDVGVGRAP